MFMYYCKYGNDDTLSYLNAYGFISHFRDSSMSGAGSINMPDVINYYERIEAYGEFHEFINMMVYIDQIYLKYQNEQSKVKSKAK